MKKLILEIKKLFQYLLGKSDELKDLDHKDMLLAKIVLDLHRKKKHSEFVQIPLFASKKIH